MKKLSALILALAMVLCLAACGEKEDSGIKVYVSLSNAGECVVAAQQIIVTDEDGDGYCTVDEALKEAHKAIGKESEYVSAEGDYGLFATKILGDESGAFGYYVNNQAPENLAAKITTGDYVYAFVYKDTTYYSDAYSYFDKCAAEVKTGETVDLTLSTLGFDANWNTVSLAGADMTITVDGEDYSVTDANGKVSLSFDKAGTYEISAKSASQILVSPICIITVK